MGVEAITCERIEPPKRASTSPMLTNGVSTSARIISFLASARMSIVTSLMSLDPQQVRRRKQTRDRLVRASSSLSVQTTCHVVQWRAVRPSTCSLPFATPPPNSLGCHRPKQQQPRHSTLAPQAYCTWLPLEHRLPDTLSA